MATKLRVCVRCRSATNLQRLGPVSGEVKGLLVTVHGLPVLTCSNGHRQFIHREFPLQLLERLVDKDEVELPAGEEKGMLFKHFYCKACDAELLPKPDHRHTFTIDVSFPDIDSFRIDLTMPVYKCSGCGKEQLHSLKEVQSRTPAALVHVFQASEIGHD
jgi:hypothetical protein